MKTQLMTKIQLMTIINYIFPKNITETTEYLSYHVRPYNQNIREKS
jgi:hypothetical protein